MSTQDNLNQAQFSRFSPHKAYELRTQGIDPDNPDLLNRQEFAERYAPGHYPKMPLAHVLAIQNQVDTGYKPSMADDMRENGFDPTKPIRVGIRYQHDLSVGGEVDDGHHRIAAAMAAELTHIPVDVEDHRRNAR